MFLLKKLVSYLLLPLPVALALLVAGLALLWFTTRQRTGKVLITTALGVLLISSSAVCAGWTRGRLRAEFNPLQSLADAPGTRWIVVLGSGYSDAPRVPPTFRVDSTGLERLVEAIRLYRTRPGAKLVLSGGTFWGKLSQAEALAQAAEALGVPRSDLVLEAASDDTQDEAVLVHAIVHDDPFVLVTSILHMRRSMRLFRKQGMKPVPAPAGFWPNHFSMLPSSGQLVTTDAIEHEYVGMLWSLLRGTI